MKINGSFEQGVFVVIILALEKDHAPVKSRVMSEVLKVSDSYLKKILMKLSKNGLVSSNASKQGGYQLTKSVENISLKDVFCALELNQGVFESSHYAQTLFKNREHVLQSEKKIEKTMTNSLNSFYDELDKLKISELLEDGAYQNGAIVWENEV